MPTLALAVTIAATGLFLWRARRFRRSPLHLACAGWVFASGVLMAALAAAHSGAVLVVAARRDGPLVYDFRLYSLLLLGAVLIALPLVCAFAAPGLARGEPAARRRATVGAAGLLAVSLPLIPLQGFAVGFSAMALLDLAALLTLRRGFGSLRPPEAKVTKPN